MVLFISAYLILIMMLNQVSITATFPLFHIITCIYYIFHTFFL